MNFKRNADLNYIKIIWNEDYLMGKRENKFFLLLLISTAIIECVVAATFLGKWDIEAFNFPWAKVSANDWFGMYRPRMDKIHLVNYPPLVPTLFWPFGKIINHFGLSLTSGSQFDIAVSFLLIKLVSMGFQWLTAIFVYWKSKSKQYGLLLSALILLNPSIWLNAAFWGQLDSALIFFTVVSFYYLQNNRYSLASLWFGLGCLAKLQFMYLVPVFGLYLLWKAPWKKVIQSVVQVIAVNIIGWLPFMINMKQLLLPYNIFSEGLGRPNVSYNALNFWAGILPADAKLAAHIFPWLTYSQLNTIILILIIVSLCVLIWCFAHHKINSFPLAYVGAIYSGLIFMFTMGQHERYQISVLAFLVLLLVDASPNTNRPFVWYTYATAVTFVNQGLLYLGAYLAVRTLPIYSQLIQWGGIVNFILFVGLVCELFWRNRKQSGISLQNL
ncbi:glycosyltransferase 87 family protein [Loigolactobacillus zhaoyuanensis]|uniref:Glycosyltransferase 87 family protein n=1 Tax=Loigolactobacillus zhaoyuanensis TaxID=2486017 RepID=A0ABW8UJR3_9LACO